MRNIWTKKGWIFLGFTSAKNKLTSIMHMFANLILHSEEILFKDEKIK